MTGPNLDENTPSVDPYRTFKFRVFWDGRLVAGVSKVGGLTRIPTVKSHRQSGMASPPPALLRKCDEGFTL